jgi:mRNA interferase MazF
MTNLKPGAVVLVNFPFTDLQSSKVRPALVLTTKGEDVVILGIFSRVPEDLQESWIKIDEFHTAFNQTGLKRASIIRTEKISVVHHSLIRKEIGNISSDLMQHVKQTLRKTLKIE